MASAEVDVETRSWIAARFLNVCSTSEITFSSFCVRSLPNAMTLCL